MNRRDFNQKIFGAALATPFARQQTTKKRQFPKKLLKAPRLKEGATIGLISPSSPIPESRWQQTIENLEGLGFKLQYDEKRVLAKYGYLAGKDEERAKDVNEMFANKSIDGIWCVRGGYGSARILPMLEYSTIRNNPKVLIGYSDITALLHGIFLKTGLIGFHGPVAASDYTDYTTKYVTETLINPSEELIIPYSAENSAKEDPLYQPYTINKGIAEGRLVGGNLTLVTSLMGTPWELDTKNKLVFLEDIGEKPYRVDRMLTQLLLAGKLHKAKGILLGVFNGCEKKEGDASLTLKETLQDRLGSLGIPVMYGSSFGHIGNQYTLPIGVKARMDTEANTLTLLEPAVI